MCSLVSHVLKCCIKFQDYFADEIGVLSPNQIQVDELYAGEVVYSFEHKLFSSLFHLLSCDAVFLNDKCY